MGFLIFIFIGLAMPIMFLAYNIFCFKNKKVIYTIKNKNYLIIDDKYYKLQLYFSITNCIFISIFTFLIRNRKDTIFLWVIIIIFWVINYLLKYSALKKGYIKNAH